MTPDDWWGLALAVLDGLALVWCALVVALLLEQRRRGRSVDWREALRLVPDVLRLLRALIRDDTLPRSVRWSLIGLLGYLLLPIDLIPDVIPVLGAADDVIAVALVLRFAIRRSGTAAIRRHWTGSAEGLSSVLALAGVRPDAR